MQEILKIYSKYISKSGRLTKEKSFIYNYFIVPFSAGLAGFAGFLFLLILMNFAAFVAGASSSAIIGINEVLIAVLGFILQFAYQVIKTIREN